MLCGTIIPRSFPPARARALFCCPFSVTRNKFTSLRNVGIVQKFISKRSEFEGFPFILGYIVSLPLAISFIRASILERVRFYGIFLERRFVKGKNCKHYDIWKQAH